MGFDHIVKSAQPISAGEDDERGQRQTDVNAVELARSLQAGPGDLGPTPLLSARQIDHSNGQPRQEDEGLRAVREAKVPRRQILEQIAGDMVDHDRDQHNAAPKIDAADPFRFVHRTPVSRTGPPAG